MFRKEKIYISSLVLLLTICTNFLNCYTSPINSFSNKGKSEISDKSDNSSYKLVVKRSAEDYFEEFMNSKQVINDVDANNWTEFKTVKFGKYEIDGNLENGDEDIEWFVLETSGKEVTLFSKYVLCPFKNCNDFFDKAFNDIDKKLLSTVERNENLFLISEKEIDKCFNKEGKVLTELISTEITPYLLSQDLVDYYDNTPIKNEGVMVYPIAEISYFKQRGRKSKVRKCCKLNGKYTEVFESSLSYNDAVGLRPLIKIDFNKVLK